MIVVVGFMGAGKTTIGRMLAQRLGLEFLDSDLVIEDRAGRAIKEIFAEHGEASFRDIEEATIESLLAGPACVLSLGGGALGREATRRRLAEHIVVYLHVELAEALARVGGDEGRPMLRDPALAELFAGRQEVYAGVATIVARTTGRTVEEIAGEVIEAVGRNGPAAPQGA